MVFMIYIKKLKHLTLNRLKIIYYLGFNNTKYKIESIKSNQVVIHHHLGLGDLIICNGIINLLSEKFEKIYIPSLEKNLSHTKYLYSENQKVKIFKINKNKEIYGYKPSIEKLRIGFEKNYGKFNVSFYKQLKLPYSNSFDFFKLPDNKEDENKLFEHLMNFYNIEKDYILVHRTSSQGQVDLKISNEIPIVYVEKNSDIFNNIFLYKKVIQNAKQIHCIDSSFLHLVERIDTKAELFFHPVKKEGKVSEKLELYKNWNITL